MIGCFNCPITANSQSSFRPILSVIILVINKSASVSRLSDFVDHSYDYRPNCKTPLSLITIITKQFVKNKAISTPITFKEMVMVMINAEIVHAKVLW